MHKMLHNVACRAIKTAMRELSQDPDLGKTYNDLPFDRQLDMAVKMVNVQSRIITILHYILPLLIALLALLLKVKH